MIIRESDCSVVPVKSGNADGGKAATCHYLLKEKH